MLLNLKWIINVTIFHLEFKLNVIWLIVTEATGFIIINPIVIILLKSRRFRFLLKMISGLIFIGKWFVWIFYALYFINLTFHFHLFQFNFPFLP